MTHRINQLNRKSFSCAVHAVFVLTVVLSHFIFCASSAMAEGIDLEMSIDDTFSRSSGSDVVCPGDVLTYKVRVENNSAELANDVSLFDLLPSGTYTTDTLVDGGTRAMGFIKGSLTNVELNASNRLSFPVNSESLTGSFESRIIDSGADRAWLGMSWVTTSPVGKALADDRHSETHFESGLVSLFDNVLLFHCDQNESSVRDASGSGNDGFYSGAVSLEAGVFSSALVFDGQDDYLVVANEDLLDFNEGVSVSLWMNAITVSPEGMSLIGKRGDNGYSFSLSITSSGQVHLLCTDSDGQIIEITSEDNAIIENEWYHLGSRMDFAGGSFSLYINGSRVEAETVILGPEGPDGPGIGIDMSNSSSMSTPSDQSLYIGCSDDGVEKHSYFDGMIDEVAVMNTACNEESFIALAQRGLSDVTFQVRVCDDGFCSDDGQFIGPDGTSQTSFSAATTATPGYANVDLSALQLVGRYIQYKASFSRMTSAANPELSQVFFRYDGGAVKIDKGECFGVTTIDCAIDMLTSAGDYAELTFSVVTPEGIKSVVNEAATSARLESGTLLHDAIKLESPVGMSQAISGIVYLDFNENGQIDASDWTFENVTVSLTTIGSDGLWETADDAVFYSSSDASGQYDFSSLCDREYRLSVERDSINGLVEAIYGGVSIDLQSLPGQKDVDVRLIGLQVLEGKAWFDTNADGVPASSNEPGIPQIQISCQWSGFDNSFDTADDKTLSVMTDESGSVNVTRIPDGTFRVVAATGDYELVSATQSNTVVIALPSDETVLFALQGTSILDAIVWFDLENERVRDAGEVVFPNAPVTYTWTGPDGLFNTSDDVVISELTDAAGNSAFTRLPAGQGSLSISTSTLPLYGLVTTTAASQPIDITTGSSAQNIEFGVKGNSILGNKIWHDFDGDGVQDSLLLQDAVTEPGLCGARISLVWAGRDGDIEAETDNYHFATDKITNISGGYCYTGLPTGYYELTITAPQGYTLTAAGIGSQSSIDSDVDQTTGKTLVYLAPSQVKIDVDAGAYKYGSVNGRVWEDRNSNGLQDDNMAISEITVSIEGFDGTGAYIQDSTQTDENGHYSFDNLVPGAYSVQIDRGDYNMHTTADNGDEAIDSDVSSDSGKIDVAMISGDAPIIDGGLILFRQVDLAVKMRANTPVCSAGDEFDLLIGIINNSDDYAYRVNWRSQLPAEATYVSGPDSIQYNPVHNVLLGSFSKMAPREKQVMTLRIRLSENFSGNFTQKFVAKTSNPEINYSNNSIFLTIEGAESSPDIADDIDDIN